MSKQSLLLVDGDARSLRVLEVSLRKAGFTVTTAFNGPDALDKLALATPDLVISETKLEEMDGFELCKRIKANPLWVDIPFVFLTAQTAIEHKVKGLELGVDDYLTKPIYIKEVVTRLQILLQKRQRTRIEERRDGRTRFVGRLSDMAVVDLIQTIEISRKSGVIQFTGEVGRQAAIYFRDGKVIDAEAGPLQGEDAVYRLLTWNDGAFEVVFRTVRRRDVITTPSQGLLMEGMRRLDEWTRLCEQLPPLDTRFEVDTRELTQRLGDIPDENNTILKLMDGRRTLNEVIDACSVGDLECLQAVSRLYFEGLLVESSDGRTQEAERRISGSGKTEDSSQWVVPATVFDETPVEAERIVVGGGRGGTTPIPITGSGRVVTVPPPIGREGSGPRTLPREGSGPRTLPREGSGPRTLPPPPSGRRASGSNPIPIARTDSESGRVFTAATVTESGRFAAPPADVATADIVAEFPVAPAPEAVTPAIGAIELAAAIARTADREVPLPSNRPAPISTAAPTEPMATVDPSVSSTGPTEPMSVVGPAGMAAELRAEFSEVPDERMRSPSGSIEIGPLHGDYRPSGLRKIDEAVAAAQLIAPQLFIEDVDDDMPSLPALAGREPESGRPAPEHREPDPADTDELVAAIGPTAAELAAADAFAEEPSYVFEAEFASVPDEYLDDEDDRSRIGTGSVSSALAAAARTADALLDAPGESRPGRTEVSSPRIVASHGKDQAQVSGELPVRHDQWPEKETTARELITIKPRRITREMPAVVPSPELLAEAEAMTAAAVATAAARTSAAMTSTAIPVTADAATAAPPGASSTAVERPRPPSRPPRGTGTSRAMTTPSTIGWMPWIFGALGVALLSAAYVRCRRNPHTPVVAMTGDAATVVVAAADAAETPDAMQVAVATPDAAEPPDAPVAAAPDAEPPPLPDAPVAERGDARATVVRDAAPGYRQFREAAQEALDDNDYDTALEMADKSLALAKGARTFLIKADALRRLDRTDEALAAVDAAIGSNTTYAPAWEMKGRILWGARRLDEGRAAYEKYLELRPTGATADRIREILGK